MDKVGASGWLSWLGIGLLVLALVVISWLWDQTLSPTLCSVRNLLEIFSLSLPLPSLTFSLSLSKTKLKRQENTLRSYRKISYPFKPGEPHNQSPRNLVSIRHRITTPPGRLDGTVEKIQVMVSGEMGKIGEEA